MKRLKKPQRRELGRELYESLSCRGSSLLQKLLQAAAVETAEAAEAAPATEEATEPIPGRIGTDTTCKLTKHDSKGNLHLEAQ